MDRRLARILASLAALGCLVPAAASAQDGDGDGVPDSRDLCRATRAGRTVDGAGCDAFCEVVFDATNGSAFLRSRLLEVGAADYGSFGTVNSPPAGWHPRAPGMQLGFVANPADDDWTNYQGDFFVPGTPEEGFGMNVGGVDYFSSRLMSVRGVVGDFTGIRVECRPRVCGVRGGGSVYWTGSRSGIDVMQTYSVFNEGLFILIEVTLTNTTASTQTVFYARNVDPDNMQTVTGSYSTTNTIVSQGDGTASSLALVRATTTAPDSYIALASSDPDARVTYGGFSNRDIDGIWNCVAGLTCTAGSTSTADIAISLAVRKIIPAGESRSFSFVYTLSPGAVAESVACTVPAVCGDGVVEGTEACDDGDMMGGDGCDATCDLETGWTCSGSPSVCTTVCGDGILAGSESCDDSNTTAGDGCSAMCAVETGWTCAGTPSACSEICGDGLIVGGESCDDSNTTAGDGCSAMCAVETGWTCAGTPSACSEICGDGLVVGMEPCDGGGETASCDADCTTVMCGDGTVNATAGEACDDSGESATCDADCTAVMCGDGVVNATAGEACDDSGESATCDADCTAASCGDGVVNTTAAETCDDSGESATCDADCTAASCGDGVTNVTAGELCDGAGESVTCDADCTAAECGDGTVNPTAGESCDDGNTVAGDGCSAACVSEACGDGAVTGEEQCDDGGESAMCDADCTLAECGDAVVNALAGEACDGGGETAACDADCTAAECGDAVANATAGEECDDGNTTAGDGCSATCRAEEPEVDGGAADAGRTDAGLPPTDAGPRRHGVSGGAGCAVGGGRSGTGLAWGAIALAGALALARRRRRRR